MINQHSTGTAPSIDKLGFEIICEISRCGLNPKIASALRPLAQILSTLRHAQAGECDAEMLDRARNALDELRKLLEPKMAEAPKPSKPRLRVFTGAAERVR